jgi:hypothetical protein
LGRLPLVGRPALVSGLKPVGALTGLVIAAFGLPLIRRF